MPTPAMMDDHLSITCLIIDDSYEPVGDAFVIDTLPNHTFRQVKEKLFEQCPHALDQCDAGDLLLWKPKQDLPLVDPDLVHINHDTFKADNTSLFVTSKVEDQFQNPLSGGCVHMLVRLPRIRVQVSSSAFRTEPPRKRSKLDDIDDELRRLQPMFEEAPSTLGKDPTQFKRVANDVVNYNRPFDFDTIPIALLQREFAEFKDDCDLIPSPETQLLLRNLTEIWCQWYEDEISRGTKVQKAFQSDVGLFLTAENILGTLYATDVVLAVIRECKNEHGNALYEAIGYYVQFLKKKLAYHDRFPCILMIGIGTYLGFYGCLWSGELLSVEPLTPFYDLTTHWTDDSIRRNIASGLHAFLKCVPRLRAHYAEVKNNPPSLQNRSYPYQTHYNDRLGRQINFEYLRRMPEKLIFVDRDGKGNLLCIKVTRHYSGEAHQLLAGLGNAPRLHAVTALPGGWKMVVMDWCSNDRLYDIAPKLTETIQRKVATTVQKIVQTLHDNDFVHGDIRGSNILVDSESLQADTINCMMIDFDWAGKIEQARYPLRVNTFNRPEGAFDGELITVQHDMYMVDRIFSS